MNVRIGIVEDNPDDLANLKSLLEKYQYDKKCTLNCRCFASGEEFLKTSSCKYDIIFMDVELKGIDGIETSKIIRENDPDVAIVIITSLIQYAIQGYSVKAVDYLLKPILYEQFAVKMDEYMRLINRKKQFILVKTEEGIIKMKINEIAYLEVFGHKLYVIYKKEKKRIIGTLKQMEETLIPYGFAKCNKCYLVNLAHVDGIYGNDVEVSGIALKISRREKSEFIHKLVGFEGI